MHLYTRDRIICVACECACVTTTKSTCIQIFLNYSSTHCQILQCTYIQSHICKRRHKYKSINNETYLSTPSSQTHVKYTEPHTHTLTYLYWLLSVNVFDKYQEFSYNCSAASL